MRTNLEQNGWDGEWYRRAYFDDGSPLGSADNPECQIDSVSQSWSVLSGAAEAGRSAMAMEAVDRRLVRRADGLIRRHGYCSLTGEQDEKLVRRSPFAGDGVARRQVEDGGRVRDCAAVGRVQRREERDSGKLVRDR
jgi:hypothetical protein